MLGERRRRARTWSARTLGVWAAEHGCVTANETDTNVRHRGGHAYRWSRTTAPLVLRRTRRDMLGAWPAFASNPRVAMGCPRPRPQLTVTVAVAFLDGSAWLVAMMSASTLELGDVYDHLLSLRSW